MPYFGKKKKKILNFRTKYDPNVFFDKLKSFKRI